MRRRKSFTWIFYLILILGVSYFFKSKDHKREGAINAQASETISPSSSSSSSSSTTSSAGNEHVLGDVKLLEMPQLSGNEADYYITHKVDNGKQVNYSLEYNVKAHHARWVCYSVDSYTAQRNVSRKNAWSWDPLVPSRYEVVNKDFDKGVFSRGHLVASGDRLFSRAANKQTFYYTNMSPQRFAFNAGIWKQMEQCVQDWGASLRGEDKLYIAKGGTIRADQIEAHRSGGKIVVPKYYWMAILRKEGSHWYSLAFLAEHSKPKASRSGLKSYTLSVDELEQFTGLDLFHNLPNKIEDEVESQDPTGYIAHWPNL